MNNDEQQSHLVSLYNLNAGDIKIKHYHDCSIIRTIWFVSIYFNKNKYHGQSVCKNTAKSIAIKK